MNKKKENSVRSLVRLYTVVIGVSLSLSIATLIDPKQGIGSLTLSNILLFSAFISILVPFYHGALRHLDDAYLENENEHIRDGALIIDFVLLFIHGLVFVALSLLISKPNHYIWVLLLLLGVDVVWGVFAFFGSSSQGHSTEGKWTLINLLFVIAWACYLITHDIFLANIESPLKLSILIASSCIIRTIIDYVWCYKFYFPK